MSDKKNKKRGSTKVVIAIAAAFIVAGLIFAGGFLIISRSSDDTDVHNESSSTLEESRESSQATSDSKDENPTDEASADKSSKDSASKKAASSTSESSDTQKASKKNPNMQEDKNQNTINSSDTFTYNFYGFLLYFPKSLEGNLSFTEHPSDGSWIGQLDIYFVADYASHPTALLAQIGRDYGDTEANLAARYTRDFPKASESEIAGWGVVEESTVIWDQVGLYPLAFTSINGTSYFIEWNAEKFMNSDVVEEGSVIYDEFMSAKVVMKDLLYSMHINRDVEYSMSAASESNGYYTK